MSRDFNTLERAAARLVSEQRPHDAIGIYLYMADGDPSLDGGYLAERLGERYELKGDLHAAKYWYGRAIEENPDDRAKSKEALSRLSHVTIDHLLRSTVKTLFLGGR